MKNPLLLLCLLFTLGSCKHSKHQANTVACHYRHLEGDINGAGITMDLVQNGDEYSGTYYYSDTARPVSFSGNADSSRLIRLEENEPGSHGGVFSGKFISPVHFTGSWTDSFHVQADTFDLKEAYPAGTMLFKGYALKDSVKLFPDEKNSQRALVDYAVLWPGNNFPDTGKALVADSILKTFLLVKNVMRPDAALKEARDSFYVGYASVKAGISKKKLERSPVFNWDSDIRMKVLWNDHWLLSLEFDRYDYTGGAHGLENAFVKVFDLKNNKAVSLQDVFEPGYEHTLQAALETQLRKQYLIPDNEPLNGEKGILFDKHITLTDNFYLTGKGIGFIYNPYEIAAYVYGRIDLFVPFSGLKSVLRWK